MGAATLGGELSVAVGALYARGRPRGAEPLVLQGFEDGQVVSLALRAESDRVEFSAVWAAGQANEERFQGTVRVEWEPANLGGQRPVFRCGWPPCSRPARRLFFAAGLLVCRRCAGVRYASHRRGIDPRERRLERIAAIRGRLGGRPEHGAPLPPRPKGMHATTYERLCAELAVLEDEEWEALNLAVANGECSVLEVFAQQLQFQLEQQRRDAALPG